MRNRAVALCGLLALVLAVVGPALGGPATITTTGTLVSKAKDSLVVRIDQHGHRITFAIEPSTVLPEGLAAGRRVRVVYHPTGPTGQTADEVVLLEERAPKRER
jgi:hypothetical protein